MADAAIMTTRRSEDFNTTSWEGDSVPSMVYGVDLNDWSVSNGKYVIVQDGTSGMSGSNGAFSSSNGWTVEWRMKMDTGNLPTACTLAGGQVTFGRGSLSLHLCDEQASVAHWSHITMGRDGSGRWVIYDALDTDVYYQGGDIETFTTVRLAVEGSGGDDQINLYVNDELVTSPTLTAGAYNRQWFGDESAEVSSGTAIVDYFRYDTTGAYAPVYVPNSDPHRGHRVLVSEGLQIEAMAFPAVTGYFDTDVWEDSSFTTVQLQYLTYLYYLMPTSPAIPWARTMHPEELYAAGADPADADLQSWEQPYASRLIRLQLTDECHINETDVLLNLTAAVKSLRARYEDILLCTSDGGTAYTVAELAHYMAVVEPDMLMFAEYPYDGNVVGGSPTVLYTSLEKYRKLGLAGNDGTGTNPIPVGRYIQTFTYSVLNNHVVSESEIRLDQFATWAFGCKLACAFVYDSPQVGGSSAVLFSGTGTGTTTAQFDQVVGTNRKSLNLGPALVRLISTDVQMVMGRHDDGGPTSNGLPTGVTAWSSSADPYITAITVTNAGTENGGLDGDVIVGYFEPLAAEYTNEGHDDDIYFMVVNGLTGATGSALECRQEIRLDFDFLSSGIDSLLRLNPNTGVVDELGLIPDGGATYHLIWTLDGGTGDLFKFKNGGAFVGFDSPEPGAVIIISGGGDGGET